MYLLQKLRKKAFAKTLSMILVFAMVIGMIPANTAMVVKAEEGGIEVETPMLNACVQIQIGDAAPELMQLYKNGTYEYEYTSASAGEVEATLLIDGAEIGTDKVSVTADETVYFRLGEGKFTNSKNFAIQSAAFVGNFAGLEFVKKDGVSDNGISGNDVRYDIASWKPSDPNAELDYVGGGIYQRTFYFKELDSEVVIADDGYKVAANDSWDVSWGEGSGNIPLTIPAGTSELTVVADTVNGIVYDSIRSEAHSVTADGYQLVPFMDTVSLIGTVRNGTDDWVLDTKGFEFTQVSDSLYIYQGIYSENALYKLAFNYEKWADGSDNNLTIENENTYVVFLFDSENNKLYDSITGFGDIADLLGMKATPPENKITHNGNDTIQFTCAPDGGASSVSLVYGLYDGSTVKDIKTVTLKDKKNGSFVSDNLYFGDEKAQIAYYYTVDGADILDGKNENSITVDGKEYSLYVKNKFNGRWVSLPGTVNGNGWAPSRESEKMTYKGNGIYELVVKNVGPANYEYKIAIEGSWDENYGKDGIEHGANISLVVSKTQDITFTYNDISHLVVNSVDYIFADVTLESQKIPDGSVKMTDDMLRGIYSVTLDLEAGEYKDFVCKCDDREYKLMSFTLTKDKAVNFYFDPVTEIFYSDAPETPVETEHIKFDSKDENFKKPFGAVKQEEPVTFAIETGTDAAKVELVVKKVGKYELEKKGAAEAGVQKWITSESISLVDIGEYDYFFVIYNTEGAISIYADDSSMDYGEGKSTDLMNATPYDLIVYDKSFTTPDWMKNAVIYQIFPDRFYDAVSENDLAQQSSRGATDYEYVSDWYMYPENPEQELLEAADAEDDTVEANKKHVYPSNAFSGDGNWSNEIYGGDIKGITERLDYLQELGVTVIYLNPVCSSISSHRYDASDYSILDPILGDMGDFEELATEAEKRHMYIILDGVFNHVADDSKYFDRYYKFLEAGTTQLGAYPYWAYVFDAISERKLTKAQAEAEATEYFKKNYGITDFTYTKWFDFTGSFMIDDDKNVVTDSVGMRKGKGVYAYDCWWGYDSMPVIISTNGSEYQTPGWADEIIGKDTGDLDGSITKLWLSKGSDGWRLDVANEVSDETWQHFRKSVKALSNDNVIVGEIWGDAVNYLLGDMYDSVMNYMFRSAVLSYVKDGDLEGATITLERLRERYPEEAWYAMMNLVDSHDTTRILSTLDGIEDDRSQKDIANAFPTYEGTSDAAKQKQYVVALLQMTYAGAPTIYYGDELGMVGADDPDDRRAMIWGKGNQDLVEWYAKMAKIRSQYSALRTGSVSMFDAGEKVMAYTRGDEDNTLLVMANSTDQAVNVSVSFNGLGMDDGTYTDLVNNKTITVSGGSADVEVPAYRGCVIVSSSKAADIAINTENLKPGYDSAYTITSEGRETAETVTVDKTALTLKIGETAQLKAEITPANAVDRRGSWRSSDETVATVDANGKVKAVGGGTAEVSVSILNGEKAVCKITVPSPETPAEKEVKASQIAITGMSKKIAAGKSIQLTANVTPENATNKAVTWTTSNKKYATVDAKGKVTVKKAGIGKTVTITATAKDGSNVKATYKIKIVKHKVTKISLKASKTTVSAGKNVTVKATVETTGKTANKTLTWKSSNEAYATVNKKGKVTTKKAGKGKTVTITAQATDGSGKKAKIKIKIK